MKQKTLFDEENRLELLSQLGDPLEIIAHTEEIVKKQVFQKRSSLLNIANAIFIISYFAGFVYFHAIKSVNLLLKTVEIF